MNINKGESLYLDASFFIAYTVNTHEDSERCQKILAACFIQGCKFYVSPLIFDDAWCGLLGTYRKIARRDRAKNEGIILKAVDRFCKKMGYAKNASSQDENYATLHSRLVSLSDRIIALPGLKVLDITAENVKEYVRHGVDAMKNGLDPKDAMHVAAMKTYGIRKIVTGDKAFSRVGDLEVFRYQEYGM